MDESIANTIHMYCQMVRTGKPAASMAIQKRHINEAGQIISENRLKIHYDDLSAGWVTLWIYKHEYILEVIQSTPQEPNSVYDHWVLGKLYGYDDHAIAEFVNQPEHNSSYCI